MPIMNLSGVEIFTEKIKENLTLELIKIEGGTFLMGSNEHEEEQPIHEVKVPDFYLSRYPITNAQYVVFLNDYNNDSINSGKYIGQKMINEHQWGIKKESSGWKAVKGYELNPVINVSWFGAKEYCNWLGDKKKNYRLPSEAMWEYAAKSGNSKHEFRFSGSNRLKEVGWNSNNSFKETMPVGLKLPNKLGLYDLNGNVWEWCEDYWYGNYVEAPIDGTPWIKGGDSSRRVIRGGAWVVGNYGCRVSNRGWNDADFWNNNIGFRVALY